MNRTHGNSSIDTAKLCFNENLVRFINLKTDPEKYNLNHGLYKMAETIETMQAEITQLKSLVSILVQELQHRE